MAGRLATLLQNFSAPRTNAAAAERVKGWARHALPETTFAVNEIACTDPACPGIETVILVMAPGRKTRAVKIGKALDAVTEPDVREALDRMGT